MSRRTIQGALDRRHFLAAWIALSAVGCGRQEPDVRVDLSRRGEPEPRGKRSTLRFAVGTMLSPRETAREFRQLADYLEARTGHEIEVLQRRSYAETNALLEHGEAHFGFVCTGAYVALGDRAEILAVPVVAGKSTYASEIIVRKGDAARTMADLGHGRFAYVDPLSLSGRIYPEWYARRTTGASELPFEEIVFTQSHSGSIDLVASGRVRAAGVDSLVLERLSKAEPARVESIRVIHRSPEFGIPPFVAGASLDQPSRALLRRALLRAHAHADGSVALAALGFERFALVDPKAYAGIDEMQRAVLSTAPRGASP